MKHTAEEYSTSPDSHGAGGARAAQAAAQWLSLASAKDLLSETCVNGCSSWSHSESQETTTGSLARRSIDSAIDKASEATLPLLGEVS